MTITKGWAFCLPLIIKSNSKIHYIAAYAIYKKKLRKLNEIRCNNPGSVYKTLVKLYSPMEMVLHHVVQLVCAIHFQISLWGIIKRLGMCEKMILCVFYMYINSILDIMFPFSLFIRLFPTLTGRLPKGHGRKLRPTFSRTPLSCVKTLTFLFSLAVQTHFCHTFQTYSDSGPLPCGSLPFIQVDPMDLCRAYVISPWFSDFSLKCPPKFPNLPIFKCLSRFIN